MMLWSRQPVLNIDCEKVEFELPFYTLKGDVMIVLVSFHMEGHKR